jgi:hypothetical protein
MAWGINFYYFCVLSNYKLNLGLIKEINKLINSNNPGTTAKVK